MIYDDVVAASLLPRNKLANGAAAHPVAALYSAGVRNLTKNLSLIVARSSLVSAGSIVMPLSSDAAGPLFTRDALVDVVGQGTIVQAVSGVL